MAIANPKLINALRKTILKLKDGSPYQWGHMGACNCGNLAQEITKLGKGEIHRHAMQRHGDWNEQLTDYCPTSGYPMDLMISKMIESGLSIDDLMHLENLSDPDILSQIPPEKRQHILRNSKDDVILYMGAWLKLLEKDWLNQQDSGYFKELEKINHHEVLS